MTDIIFGGELSI